MNFNSSSSFSYDDIDDDDSDDYINLSRNLHHIKEESSSLSIMTSNLYENDENEKEVEYLPNSLIFNKLLIKKQPQQYLKQDDFTNLNNSDEPDSPAEIFASSNDDIEEQDNEENTKVLDDEQQDISIKSNDDKHIIKESKANNSLIKTLQKRNTNFQQLDNHDRKSKTISNNSKPKLQIKKQQATKLKHLQYKKSIHDESQIKIKTKGNKKIILPKLIGKKKKKKNF